MTTDHKNTLIVARLDPNWSANTTPEDVAQLLLKPGEHVRTMELVVVYRGPILLVTRVVARDDFGLHQRWELSLVSGQPPTARRLLAADAHISISRRFEICCELSLQKSLLEQEATVTIDPNWDAVFGQPEPFHILIKE